MVLDKATAIALSGDPRRPELAVPYKRPEPSEDNIDFRATASLMLGLIGVMTRVRLFSFTALAFALSAFIQRGPDTDVRQLMMSAMCGVWGIVFPYLAARQRGTAEDAAGAPVQT